MAFRGNIIELIPIVWRGGEWKHPFPKSISAEVNTVAPDENKIRFANSNFRPDNRCNNYTPVFLSFFLLRCPYMYVQLGLPVRLLFVGKIKYIEILISQNC